MGWAVTATAASGLAGADRTAAGAADGDPEHAVDASRTPTASTDAVAAVVWRE
ncbi:hypothetical protein GCM10022284_52230 [Streptomyces hundungensis]